MSNTEALKFIDYVDTAIRNNRTVEGPAEKWFSAAAHHMTVARTCFRYAHTVERTAATHDELSTLDAQSSRMDACAHINFALAQRRMARHLANKAAAPK
jgi:hypothetical protein